MSHGDQVRSLPPGFVCSASGEGCAFAAMENVAERIFALQFHPEVEHTPNGPQIPGKFLALAGVRAEWEPEAIADGLVAQIRTQVGSQRAIAALSGGVDSAVAVALAQPALGDQLDCFYVDTGLMRANATAEVVAAFQDLGSHFSAVDASAEFLADLQAVVDPEEKRRRIGARFIRVFEREARRLEAGAKFLVQGTIYPDVVESSGSGREQAAKIKTHHNVGGLPPDLDLQLVEPLRFLFKDEVRKVGSAIGLPDSLVWRQPFPGHGLAIRCLGSVTPERLATLRAADAIMRAELAGGRLERIAASQAFAVLLPVKSVGVMGDSRTHDEVVALRCVTNSDFMTADWTRVPYELLATISSRIVNEVPGINRVVYDITSKPPATIEWE
jgi:GMP synthase (glutamine-hydrolysing)